MSRTTKLVSLFLIAFIAFSVWAKHRHGSALDAVQYWLTSGKRVELQEKYPTIGDQEVERIIVKQISGDAICIDSYNSLEIASPFHQLFAATPASSAIEPLTKLFGLDTGDEAWFAKNGFDKNVAPRSCYLYPISTPETASVGSEHQIKGRCKRSESLSEVLSNTIGEGFSITDDDSGGRVRTSLSVEKNYNVSCNLTVKKISPCLSSDYKPVTGGANVTEYLLKQFYEHNFCDHPEHKEFVSQVREKWSSALEKK